MRHLTGLIVRAIKHRGFAFLDVFQPCVTFNYLNTYDWFKERIYKLEEENHDITDKRKALEKAFEWGDRIPVGVLYQEERPTYLDGLPQVAEKPLVRQKVEVDITALMADLT